MALNDYDFEGGLIDDKNVSDNGDMAKVFVTVGQIILDFLTKFPNKLVYIEANTEIKRKLYNRIIRHNISKIESQINVFGMLENEIVEIFMDSVEYK